MQMGSGPAHNLTIFFIFFVILTTTQINSNVEGRQMAVAKAKWILVNSKIGSRPPRCDRRCNSCENCEAIQVPTNPQIKNGIKNSTTLSSISYSRSGDYNSNYKPMSWKCKCGDFIFNP